MKWMEPPSSLRNTATDYAFDIQFIERLVSRYGPFLRSPYPKLFESCVISRSPDDEKWREHHFQILKTEQLKQCLLEAKDCDESAYLKKEYKLQYERWSEDTESSVRGMVKSIEPRLQKVEAFALQMQKLLPSLAGISQALVGLERRVDNLSKEMTQMKNARAQIPSPAGNSNQAHAVAALQTARNGFKNLMQELQDKITTLERSKNRAPAQVPVVNQVPDHSAAIQALKREIDANQCNNTQLRQELDALKAASSSSSTQGIQALKKEIKALKANQGKGNPSAMIKTLRQEMDALKTANRSNGSNQSPDLSDLKKEIESLKTKLNVTWISTLIGGLTVLFAGHWIRDFFYDLMPGKRRRLLQSQETCDSLIFWICFVIVALVCLIYLIRLDWKPAPDFVHPNIDRV